MPALTKQKKVYIRLCKNKKIAIIAVAEITYSDLLSLEKERKIY